MVVGNSHSTIRHCDFHKKFYTYIKVNGWETFLKVHIAHWGSPRPSILVAKPHTHIRQTMDDAIVSNSAKSDALSSMVKAFIWLSSIFWCSASGSSTLPVMVNEHDVIRVTETAKIDAVNVLIGMWKQGGKKHILDVVGPQKISGEFISSQFGLCVFLRCWHTHHNNKLHNIYWHFQQGIFCS